MRVKPMWVRSPPTQLNFILEKALRKADSFFEEQMSAAKGRKPHLREVRFWQIVLQNSKDGLRLIFREKSDEAIIVDRCALKRATERAKDREFPLALSCDCDDRALSCFWRSLSVVF